MSAELVCHHPRRRDEGDEGDKGDKGDKEAEEAEEAGEKYPLPITHYPLPEIFTESP